MKNILIKAAGILAVAVTLISCGPSALVVRERPAPVVVVRPAAPAANYVWIDGGYIRSGRGYVYKSGYWAAPSRRYNSYRPGYWAPRGNGYYWHRGRRY